MKRRKRMMPMIEALGLIVALWACGSESLQEAERLSLYQRAPALMTERAHAVGVVSAGQLMILGGLRDGAAMDTIERLEGESWRTLEARLPTPRALYGAAQIGDRIYLVGGKHQWSLDSVDIFEPGEARWSQGEPMPQARHGHAVVAVGEALYVLGGTDGRRSFSSMLAYDTRTNTWSELEGPPGVVGKGVRGVYLERLVEAEDGATATQRLLFAFGGHDDSEARCAPVQTSKECGPLRSGAVHDLELGRWRALPLAPRPLHEAAVVAHEDALYFFGGYEAWALDQALRLDLKTQRWSFLEALPEARAGAVALAQDGALWVVGGYEAGAQRSVFRFDPAAR